MTPEDERNHERYLAAMHAVQSAVALDIATVGDARADEHDGTPPAPHRQSGSGVRMTRELCIAKDADRHCLLEAGHDGACVFPRTLREQLEREAQERASRRAEERPS